MKVAHVICETIRIDSIFYGGFFLQTKPETRSLRYKAKMKICALHVLL